MSASALAEGLKKWGCDGPKEAKQGGAAGRSGGSESTSAGARSQSKEGTPGAALDLRRVEPNSFHCARVASVISSPTQAAGSRRPS